MSSEAPPPIFFAELVAPTLLGMMLTCPLYGVGVAQAISYYRTFPKDRQYLKVLVGVLMALEGAHTFLLADAVRYWYLESKLVLITPRSLLATFFFSYTAISLVQSAYALRVYHISRKKKFITGVLFFLSLLQIVGGIGIATSLTVGGTPSSVYTISSKVFGGMQLASSVVCDVMISISLVYFLNINRSGLRRTENIVDRLIIYSVNIGLITSILALINLIIWFAIPQNFDFITFHFVISGFYVNSLLVTLNSRTKFQRHLAQGFETQDITNTISDMLLTTVQTSGQSQ